MSKSERHRKLGELAELREQLRKLENRAEGILQSLRMAAFPSVIASPFDLDPQKISDYAEEYEGVHAEAKKLRTGIEKLRDDLGE